MKILEFIYNEKSISFDSTGSNSLMVNATEMAKIFGKDTRVFLKTEHVNAFIEALLLIPCGINNSFLKREEILQTNKRGGTWMHRFLALKFAAWLDPKFEAWVWTIIDQIILGHYKEMKEATVEKLQAEKDLKLKKKKLIEENPEIAEIFELELKISAADRKRLKAMKASTDQLKMDLFGNPKKEEI